MTKVQQCVSQYRNINFSTKIKVEISNGTFFLLPMRYSFISMQKSKVPLTEN